MHGFQPFIKVAHDLEKEKSSDWYWQCPDLSIMRTEYPLCSMENLYDIYQVNIREELAKRAGLFPRNRFIL